MAFPLTYAAHQKDVMHTTDSLPRFFTENICAAYSAPDVDRIVAGSEANRATTLRANTLRASVQEVEAALNQAGLAYEHVSWYVDAFVLPPESEPALRALPLFEEGGIYIQSLSSMLPPLALHANAGQDICDLCAAPGGKTTQLVALTGGKAFVTACEMHEPRAQKLEFTLSRQGAKNVTVMRTDARNLDEFFSFDRILVDAPCTGSGTLSVHNPKQLARFTPELLRKSVKSQRALLAKGLSLLRSGGELVYSTCSVLPEENDEVVTWALEHARKNTSFELANLDIPHSEDIPRLPSALREALCVCPDSRYEGFFVARIKRTK